MTSVELASAAPSHRTRTGEHQGLVFFITHPDVAIRPECAVPDWPLNERGRSRMRDMLARPWTRGIRGVFASDERKATDAAAILSEELGLSGFSVIGTLRENDRSATGYLPRPEFEAVADAFFARPHESVRGWERAIDAQARIVAAIGQVLGQAPPGDIAIIGHGGTGTLLLCALAGLAIERRHDQAATNGGNWFAFDRVTRRLRQAGWQPIDDAPDSAGAAPERSIGTTP